MVLKEIATKGYCVVNCGSVEQYRNMSAMLGTVWFEADITLREGRQYGAHNPRALDFHTDAPMANIVGWYAQVPGAPTLLKDMSELAIDEGTLEKLRGINCACPSTDRTSFSHHPVFDTKEAKARIYYAPWFVKRENLDQGNCSALERFERALEPIAVQAITLTEGQALYVDNGRMLHGRGELASNSQRLLIRHWITIAN